MKKLITLVLIIAALVVGLPKVLEMKKASDMKSQEYVMEKVEKEMGTFNTMTYQYVLKADAEFPEAEEKHFWDKFLSNTFGVEMDVTVDTDYTSGCFHEKGKVDIDFPIQGLNTNENLDIYYMDTSFGSITYSRKKNLMGTEKWEKGDTALVYIDGMALLQILKDKGVDATMEYDAEKQTTTMTGKLPSAEWLEFLVSSVNVDMQNALTKYVTGEMMEGSFAEFSYVLDVEKEVRPLRIEIDIKDTFTALAMSIANELGKKNVPVTAENVAELAQYTNATLTVDFKDFNSFEAIELPDEVLNNK